MRVKLIALILLVCFLSGCAGTGFSKKATWMPDAIAVSPCINTPHDINDWTVPYTTMTFRWDFDEPKDECKREHKQENSIIKGVK